MSLIFDRSFSFLHRFEQHYSGSLYNAMAKFLRLLQVSSRSGSLPNLPHVRGLPLDLHAKPVVAMETPEDRVNMESEGVTEDMCGGATDALRLLGDVTMTENGCVTLDVGKATGSTVTSFMGMLFGSRDTPVVRM